MTVCMCRSRKLACGGTLNNHGLGMLSRHLVAALKRTPLNGCRQQQCCLSSWLRGGPLPEAAPRPCMMLATLPADNAAQSPPGVSRHQTSCTSSRKDGTIGLLWRSAASRAGRLGSSQPGTGVLVTKVGKDLSFRSLMIIIGHGIGECILILFLNNDARQIDAPTFFRLLMCIEQTGVVTPAPHMLTGIITDTKRMADTKHPLVAQLAIWLTQCCLGDLVSFDRPADHKCHS
jgi:hypothetical protein